jgi:predicted MFS family arabinose efflux permease
LSPTLHPPIRAAGYRRVISNPVLRRVLPGFAVSSLGDGMAVVAVGWLAIELSPVADRGTWVALATAAYSLSGAVGALLLGRFLRHRRPELLAGADAALRAGALGAIPVLYAWDALGVQTYVVLLAVSSVLHSWGSAGTYTLLARVLPGRDHQAGNAVLASIGSLSTVLGPPLAGVLIVVGGAATVIAVDATSFLVLAVTYLLLVPRSVGLDRPPAEAPPPAGLAAIRRSPALVGLLGLSFAFFFLFGPVYVALPLLAAERPGSAGLLATFYSAFGAGAVLGSVLAGFLSRLPPWPSLITLVVGFGLVMLPIGLGGPTAIGVGCFALAGLLWPPYATISTSLVQRTAAGPLLPQALAAKSAVGVLSVPLGTILGGLLVTSFGPTATLLFSASAIAGLGLVAAVARALKIITGIGVLPTRIVGQIFPSDAHQDRRR